MRSRFAFLTAVMAGFMALSGCVPAAIGAGGAVVADDIAEDRGGNLF